MRGDLLLMCLWDCDASQKYSNNKQHKDNEKHKDNDHNKDTTTYYDLTVTLHERGGSHQETDLSGHSPSLFDANAPP